MVREDFRGGVGLLVRPNGDADQVLAVDLTVRPQGPHRTVVLPLPVSPEDADRVEWLAAPDPALFTRLDALFHPLRRSVGSDDFEPNARAPSARTPPKATVEGGIVIGRDGLLQVGLTGKTGEIAPDTVCVWARITPPALPVLVRWLGLNWGWPKAALAVRMPRPGPRRLIFPTRGVAAWPGAFKPGPTLYVQTPREPGPVWADPQHAPGHPFDWRRQEREGGRPPPVDEEWPLYRAYCTDRAATQDVVIEMLEHGQRAGGSSQ